MTPSQAILSLLDNAAEVRKSYENNEPGSRNTSLELALALLGQLVIPKRVPAKDLWAEVRSNE